MAAIVDPERKIDLNALYADLQKALPAYARPLFIRLLDEMDTTGEWDLFISQMQYPQIRIS